MRILLVLKSNFVGSSSLLNSPLIPRRKNKKQEVNVEEVDSLPNESIKDKNLKRLEKVPNSLLDNDSDDDSFEEPNKIDNKNGYHNLETFQKKQLKQKVSPTFSSVICSPCLSTNKTFTQFTLNHLFRTSKHNF